MENVILVVHIIVCIGLIGVVLLQRSEGGALGMGGGGGGGLMSGRGAASALTRTTMILAGIFFLTSLTLTTIATRTTNAQRSVGESIVEQEADDLSGSTDELTMPDLSFDSQTSDVTTDDLTVENDLSPAPDADTTAPVDDLAPAENTETPE